MFLLVILNSIGIHLFVLSFFLVKAKLPFKFVSCRREVEVNFVNLVCSPIEACHHDKSVLAFSRAEIVLYFLIIVALIVQISNIIINCMVDRKLCDCIDVHKEAIVKSKRLC